MREYDDFSVQRELALAIKHDNYFEVKYLLMNRGADATGYEYCADKTKRLDSYATHTGITIAEYAGLHCRNYQIFKLLFQYGMDPEETLRACMRSPNLQGVLQCLLHGADANACEKDQRTKLRAYLQEIVDHPKRRTSSERECIVCTLYNYGYQDDGSVLSLLEDSDKQGITDILKINPVTREELEDIMRWTIFNWNIANPNKNPNNYITTRVLEPVSDAPYEKTAKC